MLPAIRHQRLAGCQHEGIALTLMVLADLALQQGKANEAAERLVQSLRLWRELGARQRVIETAEQVADVALVQGKSEQAEQLRRAVMSARTAIGAQGEMFEHTPILEQLVAMAVALVD